MPRREKDESEGEEDGGGDEADGGSARAQKIRIIYKLCKKVPQGASLGGTPYADLLLCSAKRAVLFFNVCRCNKHKSLNNTEICRSPRRGFFGAKE